MTTETKKQLSIPGIILILIGVLFLLSTLNILEIGVLIRYLVDLWPVLLIAIGVKMVVESRRRAPSPPPPPPGP